MSETVGEFVARHAALLPSERIAVTVAQAQVERGDNPEINVTTALLLAVERLSPEVDRLRADLADAQRERDALATELEHARRMGEITAARVDAVNDFIDPATGMACGTHDGERVFAESDIRAALSAGGGGPAEGGSGE